MSIILTSSQPQFVPEIDRGGIGEAIRFALIGNAPNELVHGAGRTGVVGQHLPTLDGVGYMGGTSDTAWIKRIPGFDPKLDDAFSVNWYGVLRANTSQILLGSQDAYGWRLGTAGWAPSEIKLNLIAFWGGSGFHSDPLRLPDAQLHSVALVYDGGTNELEMFLDGNLVATGTFGAEPGTIGNGQRFIVRGHASLPHGMLTVQAYAGKLSHGAVRRLADDPWHIFGHSRRRFVVVSGGGATHDLTIAKAAQGNTAAAESISQAHVLSVPDLVQAKYVDAPDITQIHALTGPGSAQAATVSTPRISQTQVLISAGGAQAQSVGTASVVQTHVLAGEDVTQAANLDTSAISKVHVLAGAGATQAQSIDAPYIGQTHVLAAADSDQTNAAVSEPISITRELEAAPAIQNNTLSTGTIAQTSTLVFPPIVQDNVAAASPIVQEHILVAAACFQRGAMGTGEIRVPGVAHAPLGSGPRLRTSRSTRPTASSRSRPRQI